VDPLPIQDPSADLPSGRGAAAILAAAVGVLALGVFAFAGDASAPIKAMFNWWKPSGPLSGVSLSAVAVWLAVWAALGWRWRRREVNFTAVNVVAFTLLFAGLLLTFPPFADLLQGK
jgi:hypothetical protein